MHRFLFAAALVLSLLWTAKAQGPDTLVSKIQNELAAPFPPPEARPEPNVSHGELMEGSYADSKIFPGTENHFQVYIPAQYNPSKPACLLVKLDGLGIFEATVLDDLIAKKEVPVIIALGISSGSVSMEGRTLRFNRSYEFDSMNNRFPDFVLNELLPQVQKLKTKDGRAIKLSADGNDHAATGASTGGIGSFTLAWQRPDQFSRVYSVIGTFVSMRGGNEYPALIRKTDPKPIRIFLEDGSTDAWNPLFGSWYDANLNMESALTFAGYDVAHAWGTHGHDGKPGQVIFPDVMRWLWRGYPDRIKTGVSNNTTLQEITLPDEHWNQLPETFHDSAGLTADSKGEVYLTDGIRIHHLGGQTLKVAGAAAEAVGPDGMIYCLVPAQKQVVAINSQGNIRVIAKDIEGRGITVTHDGIIYISEPGAHADMPSRIWQVKNGEKKLVDEGRLSAAGIAFSPDGALFYVAEKNTKWIYSYVVQPDGSFKDRQPFFWLHTDDITGVSGAEDLAVDTHGNLYVATSIGIQVCDQNGRVRAILPLPAPSGSVRSLCFGGANFDVLYVTDGTKVFTRKLKVRGYAPWSAPMAVQSQGAG